MKWLERPSQDLRLSIAFTFPALVQDRKAQAVRTGCFTGLLLFEVMGNEASFPSEPEMNAERQRGQASFQQVQPILNSFKEKTEVPHLHLRLHSPGYIELCGPDPEGKLEEFLKSKWMAQDARLVGRMVMPTGGCCCWSSDEANLPREQMDYTCDKHFVFGKEIAAGVQGNGVFLDSRYPQGENNMARLTLALAQFMNDCKCEILSCSMENRPVGGRECQLTFRSPHEKNILGPCIMVSMRQFGFIELLGANVDGILDELTGYLQQAMGCRSVAASPAFSDRKFQAQFAFPDIKLGWNSASGDNNMGKGAAGIINFMALKGGWSLVAHTEADCSAGQFRERNLLFRKDSLGFKDYFIVELRTAGRIYLNGAADGVKEAGSYFTSKGCHINPVNLCDAQYVAPQNFFSRDDDVTTNLSKRTVELADWLGGRGWTLISCSGMSHSSVAVPSLQEQHLVFARPVQMVHAPLLAVDFRVVPNSTKRDYYAVVQISGQNTAGVHDKLKSHLAQVMLCELLSPRSHCDLWFRSHALRVSGAKLQGESNFGRFSVTLCDFLADHLKEWRLVSSIGQSDSRRWHIGNQGSDNQSIYLSCLARQQLFLFRAEPTAV
eukprot:s1818_g13.t1